MDHEVACLSVETCARHFISSVGADTTKEANPPVAPASQTFANEFGAEGESERSVRVRLYVMKRRALSAP
jgi:hypothetical protein